ncbi:MAG: CDP-diacylglycerol--glycerol-3-phosphate 3-phosphatidyltransferase [Cereibacter sphaeroides]|uniref:CDP-diacylglycerol--glycerol-3-phosphate 3-phosphatidyltransferase n=1 Tax=Cereibacter sphaeroides TaxID=1063 RepID=A0A2W5SH31_CERSP|nr:MAG: CDP-diacylglycerol--glycerol-3-phosphate 3-phosphatidyltransferase [Cereibacter sphaeroides]
MTQPDSRRPLASRDTAWARALTRRLAATSITPNQISWAGIGFALLAGLAFWGAGCSSGVLRGLMLILAAAGCQLRLICNLLDGLVAIEAGKHEADGAFWNEFPDRISDILILVGLGLGLGLPSLGWAAATGAVLTAYTRELGRATGLPADFRGPMAKPQRMAVLTGAALLSVFAPLWDGRDGLLILGLWAVAIGTAVTVGLRGWRIVGALKARVEV